MVSYQKLKHVVGDKLLVEAVCLSTDAKPTENIADSSRCTEQDTGKKYLFNSGTWYNVTEDMPVEIEEPTLITLTQDTDIIDLATKAYNGEVLVQWYIDEADDMPIPLPILIPCTPLVVPMGINNPFIIGFVWNLMYVLRGGSNSSLGPNMLPTALGCFLRSTTTIHITKDDATVCGVLTDMSATSFTYLPIEDFSKQYSVIKFLITPLYSKQQKTHPVAFGMLISSKCVVTFYDGQTEAQLNQLLLGPGMSIANTEIPKGYDYWTEVIDPTEDSPHYSDKDIVNISVDGDLTFYGWGGFTVSYYDGVTGELISTERVAAGGAPANVPRVAWLWFDTADPSGGDSNLEPTTVAVSSDTSYWGWETDPRSEPEPEP